MVVALILTCFEEFGYLLSVYCINDSKYSLILLILGFFFILTGGYVVKRMKYKSLLFSENSREIKAVFESIFGINYSLAHDRYISDGAKE